MLTRSTLLRGLLGIVVVPSSLRLAKADNDYPSVQDVEKSLTLWPGADIPKYVIANGRRWKPTYENGVAKGNGEYVITMRLTDYGPAPV
jgi:hypothetical protein